MKILMHTGGLQLMRNSGIYRAFQNQVQILEKLEIPYTTDKAEDWDIAQFNTYMPDSYALARRARRQGKKVVFYAHSTREDFESSFVGSDALAPLFQMWITRCYSTGDIIITPTEYSAGLLAGYGITTPIIAISNGIDLGKYQPDPAAGAAFRKRFDYKTEDRVVLGIGHYIERKGIQDFIQIARERPDLKFIWLGFTESALLSQTIRTALKDLPPNLQLPGFIDHEDLKGAYQGSDVFFMPTYEETEGMTLLEALALRRPVLVRDIPIYETWLEDRRDVYKGRTNEAFLAALDGILQGGWPDLTARGYIKVEERSLDRSADKLRAVYHALLATEVPHSGDGSVDRDPAAAPADPSSRPA